MTIQKTIVVSERHLGGQTFCRDISWFLHEALCNINDSTLEMLVEVVKLHEFICIHLCVYRPQPHLSSDKQFARIKTSIVMFRHNHVPQGPLLTL